MFCGRSAAWTRSAALWCARTSTRKAAAPRGGIAAREPQGRETRGRAADVFLGGLTCQGKVCRFDSVDASARVFMSCATATALPRPCCACCATRRWRRGGRSGLPRPAAAAEIAHLLIPARGLAFVTTGEGVRYEGKPYRRLRVDAMAEEKLTRAEKRRTCASSAVSAARWRRKRSRPQARQARA